MKIRTKADARRFLHSYEEFTFENLWFRHNGNDAKVTEEYTIDHETEGIVAVNETAAIEYVWRNRKRLNKLMEEKR